MIDLTLSTTTNTPNGDVRFEARAQVGEIVVVATQTTSPMRLHANGYREELIRQLQLQVVHALVRAHPAWKFL